jgi:hypothetical protein
MIIVTALLVIVFDRMYKKVRNPLEHQIVHSPSRSDREYDVLRKHSRIGGLRAAVPNLLESWSQYSLVFVMPVSPHALPLNYA